MRQDLLVVFIFNTDRCQAVAVAARWSVWQSNVAKIENALEGRLDVSVWDTSSVLINRHASWTFLVRLPVSMRTWLVSMHSTITQSGGNNFATSWSSAVLGDLDNILLGDANRQLFSIVSSAVGDHQTDKQLT